MPEPPGFKQLVTLIAEKMQDKLSDERAVDLVNEIARLIWNARGSADAEAVTGYLNDAITLNMAALIKALDR
jgi:hypothetical protein